MNCKCEQLAEFNFSHEECYNAATLVSLFASQFLLERFIFPVNVFAFINIEKILFCSNLCIKITH